MSVVLGRIMLLFLLVLGTFDGVFAQDAAEEECPESQFDEWGMNGVVTPGDANNVRAEPSTSAAVVGQVSPEEPFNVVYRGVACADGYLWREIETLTLRGWTVERAAEGGEPFIVPYVPEPREVGVRADDGSIVVEESGVKFTVPAGLNIAQVTVIPEVGLFGDGMSAQPSSVVFTLLNEDAETGGEIEVFPYAISDATYEYLNYSDLETLLSDQPSLLEYAAQNRMPQVPISGTAAVFGGAGAYVPFGSGEGLRYITYFAQASVLFAPETVFEYLYRGITADRAFLVAAQEFPITVPAAAIPPSNDLDEDAYFAYLRQFEANLAEQPTNAFAPDLALLDELFASLTITDNDALLDAIP